MSSKRLLYVCVFFTSYYGYSEEITIDQTSAIRAIFRRYITHTLDSRETETPHNRLMGELLNETPNLTFVGSLIKKSPLDELDKGEFFSPLMACAVLGHNEILDQLLAKQVDVNQCNRRQMTAAMAAAIANSTTALSRLIAAGADLELEDNQSAQAFDYAKCKGHQESMRIISSALAQAKLRS